MGEPEPLDVLLRRSWHAVARVDDIGAAPVPVTLLDERLVLARLDGEIQAFDDRCPHRGAALSVGWIEDDCLVCPYHGWRYGADGACVRIPSLGEGAPLPARATLVPRRTAVHLGLVWVALDDPLFGLPEFPEFTDDGIHVVPCPPYDWDCHATRRLENFLDFAHFPWIHPGILGDPAQPRVAPHTVQRDGAVIRVHQTRVEPTNDDVKTGGLGDVTADGTVRSEMDYLVHLPLTAQLHQELPSGRRYLVWLTLSPLSSARTRTFWYVARNYALDEDDDKYVRFQQDVVAQDRPVIESQRPHRVPLELNAELYVKDDKFGLEYRRGLIEFSRRANETVVVNGSEDAACS
jgi:phenylpropionate dioxygenase-like ring-hydroxylating dioxygenase large terminal subunit